MAHTISKQIYDDEKKKYVECEILILDEEEGLPPTDRREIVLYCNEIEPVFSEISDSNVSNINDLYPETELIDEYEDYDDYKDDKFGEEGKRKYFK
jgi:hypothetical protein